MLPNSNNLKWWETTPLEQMSEDQWEALCDGCGKCCMVKIWHNAAVKYTKVGCELLNIKTAKCCDYANRQSKVKNCIKVTIESLDTPGLLPDTCAYKLIQHGKPLYEWHPLISNNQTAIIDQGHSVVSIAETTVDKISSVKMNDYFLKAVDYFDQK